MKLDQEVEGKGKEEEMETDMLVCCGSPFHKFLLSICLVGD